MGVENIVINLISKYVKDFSGDRDTLILGIKQYIIDNHLEQLVKGQQNNIEFEIIEEFLEPILSLPSDKIVLFFELYWDVQDINLVSKQIAHAAECAYYHNTCDIDLDIIEKRVIELYSKLYKYDNLRSMVDAQMSENLLDIDFIKGKTSKMSLRLSRKTGMN